MLLLSGNDYFPGLSNANIVGTCKLYFYHLKKYPHAYLINNPVKHQFVEIDHSILKKVLSIRKGAEDEVEYNLGEHPSSILQSQNLQRFDYMETLDNNKTLNCSFLMSEDLSTFSVCTHGYRTFAKFLVSDLVLMKYFQTRSKRLLDRLQVYKTTRQYYFDYYTKNFEALEEVRVPPPTVEDVNNYMYGLAWCMVCITLKILYFY